MTPVPLVMGLLSALGFGSADYLAGHAARRAGVRRTAFFVQTTNWLALSLLLAVTPSSGAGIAVASGWQLVAAVLSVILNLAGSLALLRAFAAGRSSLIAPLVATYAVVTTVLDLVTGTPFSTPHLVGIGICLLGAPLAAAKTDNPDASGHGGVAHALVAASCFGLGFWIQGRFVLPVLGAGPMLWLLFGAGSLLMASNLAITRSPLIPPLCALPVLIGQSIANLVGYASFAIGLASGDVAMVTVLSTLAAAVTALLGLCLNRERLGLLQAVGVTSVLAGVVLLRYSS